MPYDRKFAQVVIVGNMLLQAWNLLPEEAPEIAPGGFSGLERIILPNAFSRHIPEDFLIHIRSMRGRASWGGGFVSSAGDASGDVSQRIRH